MKIIRFIAITSLAVILSFAQASADTVYFKNGGGLEGIIISENSESVVMDIGFGTVTCGKREIEKIERSLPEETKAMAERWEIKRQELKVKEVEYDRERRKRYSEYEEWARQEREKKADEAVNKGTIELTRDPDSSSLLVGVAINEGIPATLVLDTGASIVVLSKRLGELLGVDLINVKNDIITLQLAGNHTVEAKIVRLKSIKIKNIEVKDVVAAVMLEDVGSGFRDGLLGMTFLNRFNLKIDLKNMKMTLEKAR